MALGKTNITTLSEGAIVTEIEDYNWIQMQSGVYSNFVKAIYENGYLVAITADGTVVHTTDGEVWQASTLEYTDCTLNDIEWDGNEFVIVGKYPDPSDSTSTKGLMVTSVDLITFSAVEGFYECNEILSAFYENGRFILICRLGVYINVAYTDMTESGTTIKTLHDSEAEFISIGKNTNGILVFANHHFRSGYIGNYSQLSFVTFDNTLRLKSYSDLTVAFKSVSVFECKNILYAMGLHETTEYNLEKVTDTGEIMTMCTGQNFMFVDGVYFDECQLFINNHDMLIVKKNESIADKTIDDLVEIAPENTMNCITKAFGQLYIFGNQGLILKSSVETNNESSITVQALSAKKALAEAKAYTDEQIAALEARVVTLEEQVAVLEGTAETE